MRNERTWLQTLAVAVPFIVLGIALVAFSAVSVKPVWLQTLLISLGTLSIGLGFRHIWGLRQVESLLRDSERFGRERDEIRRAGLVGAATDLYLEVPWSELFAEGSELEVFVAYGYAWRTMNHDQLKRFLAKPKTKLNVALVDPADPEVVAQLAKQYDSSRDDVRAKINAAYKFFADLDKPQPGKVTINFVRRAPLFTIYRFQTRAVFMMFNHRHQKDAGPTLIARAGGFLYDFLVDELDFLLGRPPHELTRTAYPPPGGSPRVPGALPSGLSADPVGHGLLRGGGQAPAAPVPAPPARPADPAAAAPLASPAESPAPEPPTHGGGESPA